MTQVSIIIVCMNRLDNLYPCLESVRRTTSVSYETLVVAYMFTPENLAKVREDFPWVSFIESDELRGFSENNNLALRQASGKYCFVLNDDTELPGPVIDSLVADLEALPEDAAIVSPKLLNADGTLQLCGRPPYPARNYVLQQFHLFAEPKDNVVGKLPLPGTKGLYRTYNITGAAFLIKTEVFRKLGWFDETYYFTPEDIALSTLANEWGYGVYVDSEVELVHKWRTTASKIMPATRPAAVRGSLIFFSRGSSLRYALISSAVFVAEMSKRVKAAIRMALRPTEENGIRLQTFRNITRSIFTRRTTKEIFIEYYNALKRRQE